MRHIARALDLFSKERTLWRYAWKPIAWAALAYLLVLALVTAIAGKAGSTWAGPWGELAGIVIGIAVVIGFGGTIYLALVALFAGFGFDALTIEVEKRVVGQAVGTPLTFSEGLADGVGRALLAGIFGLVALCLSATFVVPYLIAAVLSLMDLTAPTLLRRKVKLSRQFGVASRLPGALPFALIAGAIALVPVVNVLALPVLVVAGTLMVIEGDAAGRSRG